MVWADSIADHVVISEANGAVTVACNRVPDLTERRAENIE